MTYPEEILSSNSGLVNIMSDKKVYVYNFPSFGFYSSIRAKHTYPVTIGCIRRYKLKPTIYKQIESYMIDSYERSLVK